MRILFLTQYFQPEPNFKGLPFAKALRDRGHDVEILTGFPNYPGGVLYDGYRLGVWKKETMDGIDVFRVPLFPSHNRSGIRRILNFLSFGFTAFLLGPLLVKKPDVVYVYNLVTLGPAWRLLRLIYGCKVVVDVLDLWPESVASSGMLRSKWAMSFLSLWCRGAYRSANRLIVQSPGFKENLVARGINELRIEVVYNWCDESAITIPEPNAAVAQELGFANHFNIVFAGTMGVMQSLDTVLDAAKIVANEFSDVKFTFVGGGIEVDRLKSVSASMGNVQFLAQMPQSEIGKVLANADALLVHLKDDPIFAITIPSKIQAYLYAGKPILCGVHGNAADLVRDSGGGIPFEPEKVQSLVDAVRKLKGMTHSARTEMGLKGKSFYRDHLSFSKGVDQIETVLQGTVSQ